MKGQLSRAFILLIGLLVFSPFALAQDTTAPETLIDQPQENATALRAPLSVSGSATDAGGSGIERVELLFYSIDLGQWYEPTGMTYSDRSGARLTADLVGAGSDAVQWSAQTTLPRGRYSMFARAYDGAGNQAASWTRRVFDAVDDGQDTVAPATTFDEPRANTTVVGSPLLLSGTATDSGGSGIDRTELLFHARDLGQWYEPTSMTYSMRSGQRLIATLDGDDSDSLQWSAQATLPPGRYSVHALTHDGAGNRASSWTRRFFAVTDDMQDVVAPETTFDEPPAGATVSGSPFVVSGSATDSGGSGIVRTELLFYARDVGEWYEPTAMTYSARSGQRLVADLVGVGEDNAQWSAQVPLPAGNYVVFALTYDDSGNRADAWTRRSFSVDGVEPDETAPVTEFVVPAANSTATGSPLEISGTAVDMGGSGVMRTELLFYSADRSQWYEPESRVYSARAGKRLQAVLSDIGADESRWLARATLPPGNYRLLARTFDGEGNVATAWTRRSVRVAGLGRPPPPPPLP